MKETFETLGKKAAIELGEKCMDFLQIMKDRLEVESQSQIENLKLRGNEHKLEEIQTTQRQNRTGGTQDPALVKAQLKNGCHYLIWAVLMIIASLGSTIYVFQPFKAGPVAFLMIIGFVGVTTASMHCALKYYYEGKWLIFGISSIIALLAIFSHVHFASVRGNILETIFLNSASFYDSSISLFKFGLLLGALAIELGAGVFLYLSLENLWGPDVQDYRHLKKCRKKMIHIASQMNYLKNLPRIAECKFIEGALFGEEQRKRNLNNDSKGEKAKSLTVSFVVILIILLAVLSTSVFGDVATNNVVVILDLSMSSRNRDSTGGNSFQKNLMGIESVIKTIQPDSRFIVIGATEHSFSTPLILINSKIPREPGFFKEKINSAREKLLKDWREKSKNLKPEFRKSNIFGAVSLGAHLLEGSNNGKLIIFSDLRHYAIGFDLESPKWLSPKPLLDKVEEEGLVPELKGVQVFCVGVSSHGKSPKYFKTLREFWTGYFEKSGAILRKYSILSTFEEE